MNRTLRTVAVGLLLTVPLIAAPPPAVNNDAQLVVHVLNRIGFGARPGDVEKVRAIGPGGIARYIDERLHPDRIPDSGVATRLADLKGVGMSSREIADTYERPLEEFRRQRAANGRQNAAPPPDTPPAMQDPVQQRAQAVVLELSEQKVLRAIYSDRQLQEVLTDFWFNHFNVDARKGPDRFMLTEYERETIRPHVLGRFRDLLEATAKSPAMLFYLDNWMSADPNGPHPVAGQRPPGRTAVRGRRG